MRLKIELIHNWRVHREGDVLMMAEKQAQELIYGRVAKLFREKKGIIQFFRRIIWRVITSFKALLGI